MRIVSVPSADFLPFPLVVTHNLDIVRAMKKRVITMRKGVVVEDERMGDPYED